jgi:glucose/arabinose dehydrogenase
MPISKYIAALTCLFLMGQITDVFGEDEDRKFYGCGIYYAVIHCDPLLNKMESYEIQAKSKLVYDYRGTFADGVQNKALSLDGSDFVTGPDSNSLKLNGAFSISAWVKFNTMSYPADSKFAIVVDKSEGEETDSYGVLYDISLKKTLFGFYDGANKYVQTAKTDWEAGRWYHVTGTYDPSLTINNMKIYVDGMLNNQTTASGAPTAPVGFLRIGALSGDVPKFNWVGEIDELRIYGRMLQENEVLELYNKNPPLISLELAGHWAFDGNLNDSTINGNTAKAYGTLIASMALAPDGRLFFTEKNTGKVKIMKHEKVFDTPFVKISDLHTKGEQGLLGITLDSKFEENHLVYLYYTSEYDNGKPFNRVVRFTDDNNVGKDMVVLLDELPANIEGYHSGGALAFGPDEKLYVTVGDANTPDSSPDPERLSGKVLRINRDGTIPSDNPFPDSPVYTLGHRNMFGIAFNPAGMGIVTENGKEFYDEVNRLEKGRNYGWPTLQPPNLAPELSDSSAKPAKSYWMTIAPAQAIYYDSDAMGELKNMFVFTGFMSGNLHALRFDNGQVVEEYVIVVEAHPLVSLAQSADGSIYYGAYRIQKLESVDFANKKQVLFPVEISGSVEVKDLQLLRDEGKMILDVHPYGPTAVTVKIPTGLMGDISEDDSSYTVDTSPDYNKVTFNTLSNDAQLVITADSALSTDSTSPDFNFDPLIIVPPVAAGAAIVAILAWRYVGRK